MAEFTGDKTYVNAIKAHCDDATSRHKSPGGEVWWNYKWGSLRYAANSAFICLAVNLIVSHNNLNTNSNKDLKFYFYKNTVLGC